MKFLFIQTEKAYPVSKLCRLLGVSRSGYYAACQRSECRRRTEDRRLTVLVRESFERSFKTYGSPRIFDDLREQGERVSR